MKQWVVLSGKGGTGKTSLVAALAVLAAQEQRLVLADTDVDAANLEFLLSPTVEEKHEHTASQIAEIDPNLCTGCGTCGEVCRFGAVGHRADIYQVDYLACEGCAACFYACPAKAIRMAAQPTGLWFRSTTRLGPLFHARLFAGQENSGKLVAQVKQTARYVATMDGADLLLVDGPPGIGCPVIATVTGADLALLVVEPSVSGIHDLKRILGTVRHFSVPAAVCVNKADINPTRTAEVRAICAAEDVPLVGIIPFDTAVTEAMVNRQPVTEYRLESSVSKAIRGLWQALRAYLA